MWSKVKASLRSAEARSQPALLEAIALRFGEHHTARRQELVCPLWLQFYLIRYRSVDGNRLSVLDFGGSLGTTYFQCRDFLSAAGPFRWSIVEQPEHVKCGREEFADGRLQFYTSIAECLTHEQPNVLLLSGVIQCLPEPYEFLADVLERRFPHVIVDRTAFSLWKSRPVNRPARAGMDLSSNVSGVVFV